MKCRKLYFVRTILGDFNVFLPNPHILFFKSSIVISSSNFKYWVWSKDQVLTRYDSKASVCEFHIHGCEVSTLELIPNKCWNYFWYLTHGYYDLWVMISLWMKMNQIMSSFTLVNYLVESRFFMYQSWVVIWMISNINLNHLLNFDVINQFSYSLPTNWLLIFFNNWLITWLIGIKISSFNRPAIVIIFFISINTRCVSVFLP